MNAYDLENYANQCIEQFNIQRALVLSQKRNRANTDSEYKQVLLNNIEYLSVKTEALQSLLKEVVLGNIDQANLENKLNNKLNNAKTQIQRGEYKNASLTETAQALENKYIKWCSSDNFVGNIFTQVLSNPTLRNEFATNQKEIFDWFSKHIPFNIAPNGHISL